MNKTGLFGREFWLVIGESVSYLEVCYVGKWPFQEHGAKKLVEQTHEQGEFGLCY
jgi:hypothetical protein